MIPPRVKARTTPFTMLALACVLVAEPALSGLAQTNAAQADAFPRTVQPLLQKYCYGCHGPEPQESDLRIDSLNPNMVDGQHGGKWREVLDALDRGDMPPEDEPQPAPKERDVLIDWLTSELERAALQRRSTGGHVTLRRLTRYEYNNTMRDLLGIQLDYARDLPPDTRGSDGYKNNGVFMGMSELQLEEYYKAAKMGLAAAIVEGDPVPVIHQTANETAKVVRFDRLTLATFDKDLGGTPVGFSQPDPKKKKKGAARKNAMVLLCVDKLPETGTFRVTVTASRLMGDAQFSPPRMLVEIGHKTGVGIEPSKTLGEGDVTASPDNPQVFQFTGRLEEFPLHTGKTIKKFPGLRVIITDDNAVAPLPPQQKNNRPSGQQIVEEPIAAKPPQLLIHSIEFETPVDRKWPPETHTRILPPRQADDDTALYVRTVLNRFITRAFRRPATTDEVEWAARYFFKVRPTMESFELTMQETLALVLTSPKFLYIPEYRSQQTNDQKIPLNDYELANRLSYFLWGTMPDLQLQTLAQQGKLNTNQTLAQQVERMLSDERSWEFVQGFAGQWLGLDGVDAVAVNPEFFPSFDNSLKLDMKQETLHFFAEILHNKLSCLNFLDSDFVMVNDRMAEFYGISKPKSGEFQKTKITADVNRGGVLTQASFLLANSTGAHSHPIYRARWFLDRIMADPPGDPPADVPELDEESKSAKTLTLKQQLEAHRSRAACNRCHKKLDPWGIPFEEFDAIGQHIPTETSLAKKSRKPLVIEKETVLPDGTKISGSKELVAYLLANKKHEFAEGFSKHLLTYALGRSLEWTDQPLIEQLSKDFQKSGFRMDRLIVSIVQSDAFRFK